MLCNMVVYHAQPKKEAASVLPDIEVNMLSPQSISRVQHKRAGQPHHKPINVLHSDSIMKHSMYRHPVHILPDT